MSLKADPCLEPWIGRDGMSQPPLEEARLSRHMGGSES